MIYRRSNSVSKSVSANPKKLSSRLACLFFLSLIGLVFATGMCVIGGQLTLNAFSSNFYPAHCRATGAGWALGVGRFGSILGPLFGSLFIGMQMPVSQIFILSAIPAILAALFISQVKAPKAKDEVREWKGQVKESSPL